ncbi:MAG: peptidoglycan-associated lipoprotein Pal [Candidatus Contendobacter sp.]|jgi:peptidoglycan-associated lipoprotein|nr:peptidoglycan-associated lipoprotein Pal [Gammaproteobacteria bacterium]MCC8993538.1 peptidoglycan-associated lipoprotein Pal [Candidatus Contendobacter sp.]
MNSSFRPLIAVAALALLAGCATTEQATTEEQQTTQDAAAQPGITAQPGQEAYSYGYGQAPGGVDAYDANGSAAGGRPGQAVAGGGSMVPADRIVYFSFDSAEVLPESRTIIEANARKLTGNQRTITQLEGHTDERGSREYNIALGERRANAVRQAMIAMGVAPQQIRIVSYGEERPAATGPDEQSYALNRRVEILY